MQRTGTLRPPVLRGLGVRSACYWCQACTFSVTDGLATTPVDVAA